jgi:hypothetical protein
VLESGAAGGRWRARACQGESHACTPAACAVVCAASLPGTEGSFSICVASWATRWRARSSGTNGWQDGREDRPCGRALRMKGGPRKTARRAARVECINEEGAGATVDSAGSE